MKPSLNQIQFVFLEAMAHGWAQGVQEIEIQEFPGTKAIPFVSGEFRVLDCYTVTPNSRNSSGTTTIWYQNQPVWIMHYGGWYAKSAIPFLKTCLHRAYVEERLFYGGRGPTWVRYKQQMVYLNNIARPAFEDFEGEERINDIRTNCLGYHWYRGMSLLDND